VKQKSIGRSYNENKKYVDINEGLGRKYNTEWKLSEMRSDFEVKGRFKKGKHEM
jgi:hypothetical protein